MKFFIIIMILYIEEAHGFHDFFIRDARTIGVEQQFDSSGYLPPYNARRPPEIPRPFRPPSTIQPPSLDNGGLKGYPSQNDVANYPTYQNPSLQYVPSDDFSKGSGVTQNTPSTTPKSSYITPTSWYTTQGSDTSVTYNTMSTKQTFTTGLPKQTATYVPPSNDGYSSTRPTLGPAVKEGPYTSSGGYSSTRPNLGPGLKEGPYTSSGGYSSTRPNLGPGLKEDPYTSSGGYSSTRPTSGPMLDEGPYTSSGGYSSTRPTSGPMLYEGPYTSSGGYSSTRPTSGPVTNEGPYTSSGGYSSTRPTLGPAINEGPYTSSRPSPPFTTYTGSFDTSSKTTTTEYRDDGYSSVRPTTPFPPSERPSTKPTGGKIDESTGGSKKEEGDDLLHPPHIHKIEVQCNKSMMTIDVEFNRVFNGVIYSKGFYTNPDCRYVEENSMKSKYSFTVSLDSCGTQFISDFKNDGQAYLENVLVFQNESKIQEVWDTVRRVRCLWEGNINKALSVNFSVDMLNQEIVTFSGDTAITKLDIQVGKGPFAPVANGLVKIGEPMTLVVSVEGDPDFDLQVRDCIARDETSTNTLMLTDERGCILKPKLMGAFQKTNQTGSTGASLIAYSFFQAFKFPDVMDLIIECNVELCKTDCEPCPEANQQIEPGRRKRSVNHISSNKTRYFPIYSVRVKRELKVILLDDLKSVSNQTVRNTKMVEIEKIDRHENVCMSNVAFYVVFPLLMITLACVVIITIVQYTKLRKIRKMKVIK